MIYQGSVFCVNRSHGEVKLEFFYSRSWRKDLWEFKTILNTNLSLTSKSNISARLELKKEASFARIQSI